MRAARRDETRTPGVDPGTWVGRRSELSTLQHMLQRLSSGQGSTLFLTGGQGGGKTRIASRALELARSQKIEVLQTNATPLESGIAYLPLVRALDSALADRSPSTLETLVKGLPDLLRLLPNLPLSPPPHRADPTLEKKHIFEAIRTLLERLALQKPVLFFIDDLHWADACTIELLHFLSHGIERRPLGVMAALREDLLPSVCALRTLLTGLRHTESASILRLEALTRDEIAELVQARTGARPSRGTVAVLRKRTGGNPRLLTLLLELPGREEGWERWMELGEVSRIPLMPEGVCDMLEDRLARLEADDAELLEWIAVCADGAPYAVLRNVVERPDAVLMGGLRRLLRAHLIVEESRDEDVVYHFTNHMERLALVSGLPEGSRRIRHARWTVALEQISPQDVQRLAYHSVAAGSTLDADPVVTRLLEAGRESLRLGAAQKARCWLGAALHRARQARLNHRVAGLLEALAQAQRLHGNPDSSELLARQALDAHRRQGDPEGVARCHHMLALLRRKQGQADAERQELERGLEALADHPASIITQNLLADLIVHLTPLQAQESPHPHAPHQETLTHLQTQLESTPHAQPVRCRVLLLQAEQALHRGAYPEATLLAQHALHLAEKTRDSELLARTHLTVTTIALACGTLARVSEHGTLAADIAREAGLLEVTTKADTLLALSAWQRGEWTSALNHLQAPLLGEEIGSPARAGLSALCLVSLVYAQTGELAQASKALDCAWDLVGADGALPTHSLLLHLASAVLALEQGLPDQALNELALLESGEEGAICLPTLLLMVRGLACAEAGNAEALEAVIAELRRRDAPDQYCGVAADHLEGLRQAQGGNGGEAVRHLRHATEGYDRLGWTFEGARARLAWLELAVQKPELRGEGADAAGCLEVFQQLGAMGYTRRAERGVASLMFGAESRLPRPHRTRTGNLSARELEIASLVVKGLTSDEIGAQLFISTHTVSTHLRRLFERLGLRSRTELARYVLENHLIGGERRVG